MLYRLKKWAKNRAKGKKKKTARDDGINTGDAHLFASADDYYSTKGSDYRDGRASKCNPA